MSHRYQDDYRRRDDRDRRDRYPDRRDDRRDERRFDDRRGRDDRHRSSPTPEGIVPLHLRQRKIQNWDVPREGCENMTAMEAKKTGLFQKGPVGFTYGTNIKPNTEGVYIENTSTVVTPEMARTAKRVIFTGVEEDVDLLQDKFKEFISGLMRSKSLTKSEEEPVIEVLYDSAKKAAIVEFRTPEEATGGMQLEGISYEGNVLYTRRPREFQPIPGNIDTSIAYLNNIIENLSIDSVSRIYVGELAPFVNDEHLFEIFKHFGEIKNFFLVKDLGFAFIEYEEEKAADAALEMNGFEFCDKHLVVAKSNCDNLEQFGINLMYIALPPLINIDLLAASIAVALEEPSCILVLMNMVANEDLLDDEEYNEIMEDVKEVCSTYGKVENIIMPRPVPGQNVMGVGRVYIQYVSSEEAKRAVLGLAGRKYGDRTIIAGFYFYEKFIAGDL
ncbi:RNA-binding domain-containing protein [Rozella allomycis CSF55]|uniref:RNA-binding domain-containing protein n=1 Tax=Rozella allomycis (strain CSF55) TaxID=988480 RepID=A0A075APM3_ROZAC|nr:hypothetical protein O9G_003931 [Rozella allomycis CSF55]RKP17381.1 RNA-binding domain-containing protein [Rozella allomycis CSF55]|eukprot:EPZ32084.1 hypothetical protein O9G_003931 [Rozella allomycis CSF55]